MNRGSTYGFDSGGGDAWWHRAACRDSEPEAFTYTGPASREVNDLAMRICRRCPVIEKCFRDALEHGDTDVIRGGVRMTASVLETTKDKPCGFCGTPFRGSARYRYCTARCRDLAGRAHRNARERQRRALA